MEKKNIFFAEEKKNGEGKGGKYIEKEKVLRGRRVDGNRRLYNIGPWGPKITAGQQTTEPIILHKKMVLLVGLSILLRQQPEDLPFLSLIFEEAPSDINILKIKRSMVRSVSAKDMEIVKICQLIPN